MTNDLVSIIMLSHNRGQYIAESVRSVIAQTYLNWELLFIDDNSKDDTINQMMDLMQEGKLKRENGSSVNRIHVTQSVENRGSSLSRSSALKQARGRWMAFLDVSDVWAPDKLEKQIRFMEAHDYAFSYTKYGLINRDSEKKGIEVSGKEHINKDDLMKCCWMSYLTVMYDVEKVGRMWIRSRTEDNDYALWLDVVEKADCHLLDECLAYQRTDRHMLNPFPIRGKFSWRYGVFSKSEDLSPIVSFFMTIRNLYGGLMKKFKYVKRVKQDEVEVVI